jgi:hypothetical protein
MFYFYNLYAVTATLAFSTMFYGSSALAVAYTASLKRSQS